MSQAGFCAGNSAPFVQRGLQRRSQRGKPVVRVGDKQGAWEEEGDQLCSWLQMPSYSPRHRAAPACAAAGDEKG